MNTIWYANDVTERGGDCKQTVRYEGSDHRDDDGGGGEDGNGGGDGEGSNEDGSGEGARMPGCQSVQKENSKV